MKVDSLHPLPDQQTQFGWPYNVVVPDRPGCYALVALNGDVLYVGLASKSIRSRMAAHLDTPEKCKAGPQGVPYWFYYLVSDANVNAIERGWMNQAVLEDGEMPPLNRVQSPL